MAHDPATDHGPEQTRPFFIRFSADEFRMLNRHAVRAGVPMSTMVRHLVRKAVGMPTLGDEPEVVQP